MDSITQFTACPMDCPDSCSLAVETVEGKISGIRASNFNPDTQGFICSKVARFAKRVYSEARILHPMKRVGEKGKGKFERISWEEAADTVCGKFKQIKETSGGEAILPFYYGGSNGLLAQETVDHAFFARLGASRLARTVCAAATTEAARSMYGKMPGAAFEDYQHAKLIIIWGANPKVSNIHLMPFLKKAKAAGAKIVVIDPVNNFSKDEIDLHLPIYPGTDLVLALAMIRFWQENNLLNHNFIREHTKGVENLLAASAAHTVAQAADITKLTPQQIEQVAQIYASHNPALLRVGWGLERNRNGGKAAAAILALPALLGKFGVRGSGYTLSNGSAYKVDARELAVIPGWQTRVINMSRLGHVLTNESNPAVQGLFVYNCNPVATMPNQTAVVKGLQRGDLFTVVSEQVMTDTARFADILLPATTFLEQEEIRNGYGSYSTQYLAPAIERCGEAKPNEEMFALLGRAMGWQDEAFCETTEDYLHRAARSLKGFDNDVSLGSLKKNRIQRLAQTPVQFENVLPWTPDKKVNLAPKNFGETAFEYEELQSSPYPLALISPAGNKLTNSTLGEFNLPELFLSMNPLDAEARQLQQGDTVRVYNKIGEVKVRLLVNHRIRQGVVVLPKGAWRKASLNGWTSNALSPDTIGAIGQGACFNDARVEVCRSESP